MTEPLIGAVEAGGTKFVLAVANDVNEALDRVVIATRTPTDTFAEMIEWFGAAEARHGAIATFGIASFGPIGIDPARGDYGTFTTTPKPGWQGASFPAALARFGVPIAIDTDVNGAALGEFTARAGRGCSTLAYTTVGTGIGTGVVKDGCVLGGSSHYEAGHIRVLHDTARDPFEGCCPYHGDCLEGLASGPAIFARWGHDLSRANSEQIELIASYLADFAANLVLMHRPDRMVFGGGVAKAAGLIEALRDLTRARLGGYIAEYDRDLTTMIVPPALGDDAGITGAIELGRQALQKEEMQ